MLRWLIVLGLLVVMTPGLARGEGDGPGKDRTIAVLSLQISGDAAPELRAQVQDSLRAGLDAVGFSLIPRERVTEVLTSLPDLTDCSSATCLHQIGDAVGASQFVRAQVEAAGAAYTIRLELLAPDVEGQLKRRVEDSCPVCTITELSERIRAAAGELVAAQTQPVRVIIITRPEGATLAIDGREVGAAPYQGELSPGPHQITALLPGHLEAEQTIAISGPGETPARFEIILSSTATTQLPPPPIRRYRLWKWAAAGGAAAALLTGIAMIAVDGDGSCSSLAGECQDRYATMTPGIISVGVGLGLAGASGWMFVTDRRATPPSPHESGPLPALTPTRGGAVAGVVLRF